MSFMDHKEFWTEFINLYRSMPCLWNIKSKYYGIRSTRQDAFEELAVKCRDVFPKADVAFVKKKLDNLRSSFRREFRKLIKYPHYEPKLWYYDLLRFTVGYYNDDSTTTTNNNNKDHHNHEDDDDSSPCSTVMMVKLEDVIKVEVESEDEAASQQTDDIDEAEAIEEWCKMMTVKNYVNTNNSSNNGHLKRRLSTASLSSNFGNKRSMLLSSGTKEDLVATCKNETNSSNNDRTRVFGMNVSCQMREMDRQQRIIAEKIISEVIFHGKLGNLTYDSCVSLTTTSMKR